MASRGLIVTVMPHFAPEGTPFIAVSGGAALLALFFGGVWAAFPPFALTLFMAYFFRDPERRSPSEEGVYVAPADGKVILIREVSDNPFVAGRATEVSIFMSPLNVHVNRAPCDGKVDSVVYTPGSFVSAFKPEASMRNERIDMVMSTSSGAVVVRQVAGFVARRAVCRVKAGDALLRGQRYGIIKFSSRVDVILPEPLEITVRAGDRVRAGETIIGRRPRSA